MKVSWGTAVAAAYGLFAAATIGFVTFAMRVPVVLVRDDYYAASLQQDRRILAVRNAGALGDRTSVVAADAATLVVAVPREQASTARGTVTFYRASDAAADRVMPLAVAADGRQRISVRGYPAGHWLVQLRWSADGQEFYSERQVELR
jgi:nitrogen fixation protein FixH